MTTPSFSSDETLRFLAENASDGMFIKDRDKRYIYANPAFERLIGKSTAEVIGQTTDTIFGPELETVMRDLETTAFSGMPASDTCTITINGRDRQISIALSAFEKDGDEVGSIIGVMRSLTAGESSEDAQFSTENQYHMLFDGMYAGFALHKMIFDDDGTPVDYEFVSVNPAFERLTGMTASTVIGKRVKEVLPGVEQHWIDNFGKVVLTGNAHNFTNSFQELGRKYDVTAYRPTPGHFACIFFDVTEREKAEEALRESAELSEKLITESPVGICVFDAETGDCVASNDATAKVIGATREQVMKQNFRKIKMWKHTGVLASAEDALSKNEPTHCETEGVSSFGRQVAMDCHFAPFQAGSKRLLMATITDTSERVHMQRVIRQERDLGMALSKAGSLKEILTLCLETSIAISGMDSGGIYLVDPESGGLDLIVHQGLSKEFTETVTHYPSDSPQAALVQRGTPVYTHGNDLIESIGDPTGKGELRALMILPICDNDLPVACLNVASKAHDDIPEFARTVLEFLATHMGGAIARSQTEEDLRDSEARFRNYVESAPDGIFVVDEGCCPVEMNDAAVKAFGYTLDELRGTELFDLARPDYRQRAVSEFEELRERGSAFIELPAVRKGGEVRTFSVSAAALTENRYLLFTQDITDKVRLEEELRQSEKMQAIGQLAGGIAHDFNNQLAGIIGNADLLLEDLKDNPELAMLLQHIIAGGERAADLTSQLLAFSRKGKFVNSSVNLHDVVTEVSDLLMHSIDKKITIEYDLTADKPITVGDPTQLHNALLNLGINARDAMPQGGKLLYATRIIDLQEKFCRRFSDSVEPGSFVQIDVVDTGTGMDDATRTRAFEPFFTTKELGKGTGMGMAAVYGTVKNHGGIVSVKSTVGKGTTVTMYLPQAMDTEESPSPPSPVEETTRGSANVLLIDDDPSIQLTGSMMLEAMGYEVTVRTNGREGLDHFREHWRKIDLVLLDMIMPEMNGEETFAAMQTINPDVVVLIVSGYSLDEKAQRAICAGVAGFVQKPFRMATLSTFVSDALKSQS